ncbi:archaellin/type IV pilin N-terminal domain-containing protein [Methanospirillum sp.]|uniref:archaellin/type IV pilin N-terminal domain-containing protein n=1 Tax=Methanospirillum sp. TaxID=45200 RepID=UPI0035A1247C
MKKESAFSGLEAAIVLIAFVVVAAVFSYVMLGAGFFATQKAQEVTYSGMKQATSNLILDGMIYGSYNSTTGLAELYFYVKVPEGGETQDLQFVEYLWTIQNKAVTTVTSVSPEDKKINPGGREKVTLKVPTSGYQPKSGEKFVLEIKPKTGASTIITRTLADGYDGGVII